MKQQPETKAVMMKTQHLFDLTLELGQMVSLGPVAAGERRVAGIAGGVLAGETLRGELLSGSDTQLMRADGVLEIDAAYVVRLEHGELLRIVNQGYRHGPAEVLARLARGEAVDPSDYFFRTVMRFETAAPALAWLNGAIAVANAERQGGKVIMHAWQVL